MSNDKTVRTPDEPTFGIGEVAYVRSSALLGYVEAVTIARVRFDQAQSVYKYRYLKNSSLALGLAAQSKETDLAPFEVREEDILTLCETLDITVSVLERELAEAQEQLDNFSTGDETIPSAPVPIDTRATILQPPKPRFGINEVVYLVDTPEVTGRLERMRIDSFEFDNDRQEWNYSAVFRQKPGENATVGGRNDLRRNVTVSRFESELATLSEVLPIRVAFLQKAVDNHVARRQSECEETAGTG